MRTFFEFLYRSGRIPAEALARAQVAQLKHLPSFLELAETRGLLPAEEILKILLLQEEKEISFTQACRELGLWNPGLEQTLREELESARVPLAELLEGDPSVAPGLVAELWNSFRSGVVPEPAMAPPSIPAPELTLAPEPVEEAPLHGDPLLDEGLLAVWRALAGFAATAGPNADGCREVMHAFHQLKGTLRFQGPPAAERWADFGEQSFRIAGELGNVATATLAAAGRDALRAIAAEGSSAPTTPLGANRKEELVGLLKNLRHELDNKKVQLGESA